MAACDTCGTSILFGGVKDNGFHYCGAKCAERGRLIHSSTLIPEEEVEKSTRQLHQGNCPKCGGPGPVDVHTSYRVYSVLVMTSWSSKPEVCCRSCGTKAKVGSLFFSGILGWWGFPWGLIMTPIQVSKNLGGIFGMGLPDASTPSPSLKKAVRLMKLAQRGG